MQRWVGGLGGTGAAWVTQLCQHQVAGPESQPLKLCSHLLALLSQPLKYPPRVGFLRRVADTEKASELLLKATHNFPFTLWNK